MADISKIKLPDGNTYDVKDDSKSSATNWVNGSQDGSVRMVNSVAESSSYTIGTNAVAEGVSTTASGNASHAEGGGTQAAGDFSHAEGRGTKANGQFSHAEGGGTTAGGMDSHAEGGGTTASGPNSHSEGGGTTASGAESHAEGSSSQATGDFSHAEGYQTIASGEASHAEGSSTIANHALQHVFGQYNIADDSTAEAHIRGNYIEIVGNGTNSSARSNARTLDWSGNEVLAGKLTVGVAGTNSLDVATIGQLNNKSSATNWVNGSQDGSVRTVTSAAEDSSYTIGSYAVTEGYNTKANGYSAHAEGYNSIASGDFSHVEGYSTTASNGKDHAEGYQTTASGGCAHAEGYGTTASGLDSHAEGSETTANNDYAHAEGNGTIASGRASHAEGGETTAGGNYAHAEGYSTEAQGYSHAEGGETKATGTYSHAEGYMTTASQGRTHAEGYHTTASDYNAHAEGYYTTASGTSSHAEGYYTTASGQESHAEGDNTIANHFAQHVFGQYNIADDSTASASSRGNYIEIVGNGTSSTRSNARTLDWSGNEVLAGKLTVGVAGVNSMDVATIGQIPDVPSWAMASTKPTYTASEVGAQPTLVSGTNIKTVNGNSLLGSGNITIQSSGGTITSVETTAGTHTTINVTSGAVNFNVPTKTSHLTNDSGFITSETDPVFSASAAAGITATDISNWNSKTSNTGTVTSVGVSGSGGITISGSPITTSGTISIGLNLSTAINGLGLGNATAITDDTEIITQDTDTTHTTFYRRKASTIYNYIKPKLDLLYLPLTGGNVTGPTTFGDSVSITDLNAGQLIVNGNISAVNGINDFIINTSISNLNADNVRTSNGIWLSTSSITNAATANWGVLFNDSRGTSFQLFIPDSSNMYIYKRYYSSNAWSSWSKLSAGYADSAGTATTSSYPVGFTSGGSVATWGNTTGTTIATWNDSTGGSIDFRRDNPSSGKLSIKVDGRLYFSEGNIPVAGLKLTSEYWGLTGPDGEDNIWIRSTSPGIIPYQGGGAGSGHGSIGTSSWYWSGAYIDNINGAAYHRIFVSTSEPSGGSNGDIWFVYV